jgi:serine phosphatase RsbU (regulator of sigma subunit)
MNKLGIQLLFLSGAVFILAASLYNLSIVGSQVSDENWYRDEPEGVIIFEIISGGASEEAGLRVGDRLVMINGDSVRSALQAQTYLDDAFPGESLVYTVERNGKYLDISVTLALLGLRIWHVGLMICGFLFLLFALFIIYFKPEQKYARLLSLAMMFLAFLLINIQVGVNVTKRPLFYQMFVGLCIINSLFTVALLNHATHYFPEKKYEKINSFVMIKFLYILATVLSVLSIILLFGYSFYTPAVYGIPLLYLITVELINRKKKRKEYVVRQRVIKIVGIALMIIFVIAMVLIGIQPTLSESLIFTACLLPIAFFYTTVRYRVFDINVRIRLSIIYSLIQILIFIIFVAAIFLIIQLLPMWNIDLPALFITGSSVEFRNISQLDAQTQQQIQSGYLLLIGFLLVLILYLTKNKVQKIIDRIFFQQKYDYRIAMKQFGELLSSSFSRKDISQKSIEPIHNLLKVKGTSLAIPENGYFQFSSAYGNLNDLQSQRISIPEDLLDDIITRGTQVKPDQFEHILPLKKWQDLIYYGIPIISGQNRLEGILFTAEKLSESAYNNDDLEMLTLFAENLGSAFERARLYEEKYEKERLTKELEIARQIQLSSLPKCDPDYKGLEICSSLAPATEVGGDYYDYLEIDDSHLGIIVGDVVGKGTSGAIHMSKIQGFLKTLQLEKQPPEIMFGRLNTLIRENFNSDFFFTALYGLVDLNQRTITIYRMGHNGLIYYDSKNNRVQIIEPRGIAFGMTETDKFKEEISAQTIKYSRGDMFLFLTDGFLESMNAAKEQFGEERASTLLISNSEKTSYEIMDSLQNAIKDFSDAVQQDDATGVLVKIKDERKDSISD